MSKTKVRTPAYVKRINRLATLRREIEWLLRQRRGSLTDYRICKKARGKLFEMRRIFQELPEQLPAALRDQVDELGIFSVRAATMLPRRPHK